jgi:Carboxypeptidase regulatory-like domain
MITGEMSGTIQDSSGAVIPEAMITVTNEGTGAVRTTSSMANGEFVLSALRPGTYTIKVEKNGFKTYERKGNVLTANQRVALGIIPLAVGQVTQTVEVTAQGEVVNTENADTSSNLSTIQVTDLGVKGRDVMQLLRVLPGVTTLTVVPWGEISDSDPAGTGANGGQFGSFTPAVGGARLFWNTVTVDGQVGSNPDFPGLFMAATSLDAVSEVKVVSNNYTADYGRNPGSTIALVTKSGTRDFHGTVYGYKRSEKLNANDFFNNAEGIQKPIYRFGTFGFAVGGPVYIPHHFNTNREKLFFFYSQENWQVKQPWGRNTVYVPTEAERNGDFSQTIYPASNPVQPITIIDPTTHQPFQGNIIPPGQINQQGQLLLNLMPLPNFNDPTQPFNYVWQDNCEIPRTLQSLKLDYHATDKDTFTLGTRRWWVDTRAYGCRVLGYASSFPIFKHHYEETTDTALLTWTHIVNPTVVNEFNIGMVGEKEKSPAENLFGRTAANYFDPINRTKLGFTLGQLYPSANPDNVLPQEFFNFVPSNPGLEAEPRLPDNQGYPRFNFGDNLSWTKGPHTFKFGLYMERSWATDGPHADCFDGCFDWTHDVNNPLDSGWDFSNALLGNFREYSESNSRKFYLMAMNLIEWFGQDTWKVNHKLTLTLGARFSYFNPWHVVKGQGAEFVASQYDPTQVPALFRPVQDPNGPAGQEIAQNPVTGAYAPAVNIGAFTGDFNFPGMVVSSDKNYPVGFREQHGVQVSPRLGFAYDPVGNGKTAIRGGFAIMKEGAPSYGTYTWSMVTNPPVQVEPHIFYGNMDTLLGRQGLLFPVGASAIEKNDKVPSVYRYSVGVQRDLGHHTMADVSYVGNLGRHLIQGQDQNEIPYGARFQPQNIDPVTQTAYPDDFFRPIPGYEGISMLMNAGESNYNSLQVAVNRRFSRGVSFGVSYTWSHTLNTGNSEGDPLPTYQPWRVWTYGPANFDQTHMLVVNYVWELPKASRLVQGSGGKLVVGSVLDNWELSGVTTMASGLPQPINIGTTTGVDLTGGGDGVRANIIGRPQLSHGNRTFDRWFNTDAFAMPALPSGTTVDPGNASIYPIRGPGQNNWDITLTKKFPLKSESRNFQFRAEFYNAWNHTQFQAVDNFALFNTDPQSGPIGEQVNTDFGHVTATRQPRVIQLSLRLEF